MSGNELRRRYDPKTIELKSTYMTSLISLKQENMDRFPNADIDPLTKLFCYPFFITILQRAIMLAEQFKSPLSLILIDLDDLTNFNSAYGQSMGDLILQRYASIFNQVMSRKTDILCKTAGDEFAAILPQTDRNQAQKLAEKINSISLQTQSADQVGVTFSAGIALAMLNQTHSELYEVAYKRLKQAKNQGRNRIVFR